MTDTDIDTDELEAVEDVKCPACGHSPLFLREPLPFRHQSGDSGHRDLYCVECGRGVKERMDEEVMMAILRRSQVEDGE